MSRKIKAQLVAGRPIVIDFILDDEFIGYELICPKCENDTFVISEDKSRIACTNSVCFAVVFLRVQKTVSDMSEVTWKV